MSKSGRDALGGATGEGPQRGASPSRSLDDRQEILRLSLSRTFNTPLYLPIPASSLHAGCERPARPFTPPPVRSTRTSVPIRSAATPPPVRSTRMAVRVHGEAVSRPECASPLPVRSFSTFVPFVNLPSPVRSISSPEPSASSPSPVRSLSTPVPLSINSPTPVRSLSTPVPSASSPSPVRSLSTPVPSTKSRTPTQSLRAPVPSDDSPFPVRSLSTPAFSVDSPSPAQSLVTLVPSVDSSSRARSISTPAPSNHVDSSSFTRSFSSPVPSVDSSSPVRSLSTPVPSPDVPSLVQATSSPPPVHAGPACPPACSTASPQPAGARSAPPAGDSCPTSPRARPRVLPPGVPASPSPPPVQADSFSTCACNVASSPPIQAASTSLRVLTVPVLPPAHSVHTHPLVSPSLAHSHAAGGSRVNAHHESQHQYRRDMAFSFPPSRTFSFPSSAAALDTAFQGQGGCTCADCLRRQGLIQARGLRSPRLPAPEPLCGRTAQPTNDKNAQYYGQCVHAHRHVPQSKVLPTSTGCGGSSGQTERCDSSQALTSKMSTCPEVRTSSAVCGQPCAPKEEKERVETCVLCDPRTFSAAQPVARSCTGVGSASLASGSQLLKERISVSQFTPRLRMGYCPQTGYATVPPMTSSWLGWTRTRFQTEGEGRSDTRAAPRGRVCHGERVGEASDNHTHTRSANVCTDNEAGTANPLLQDPSLSQPGSDSGSNLTGGSDHSQCRGQRGSPPLPMPPVDDFLLRRFLDEARSVQSLLQSTLGPSSFQFPPFPPGLMFPPPPLPPPHPFPLPPSYVPYSPFPFVPPPVFSPLLRDGPVMFAPLGRSVFNLLTGRNRGESYRSHHCHQHHYHHEQQQTMGQRLDKYYSLVARLNGAKTGQESWKAFTELVAFQACCLQDLERRSRRVSLSQSMTPEGADLDLCDLQSVPLQLGVNEDVTEDFLLFCTAYRTVLNPPLY